MSAEWTVETQDPKEVEKQRRSYRIQRMVKCHEDALAVDAARTGSGFAGDVGEMASAFFLAESIERMFAIPAPRPQRHETINMPYRFRNEGECPDHASVGGSGIGSQ